MLSISNEAAVVTFCLRYHAVHAFYLDFKQNTLHKTMFLPLIKDFSNV